MSSSHLDEDDENSFDDIEWEDGDDESNIDYNQPKIRKVDDTIGSVEMPTRRKRRLSTLEYSQLQSMAVLHHKQLLSDMTYQSIKTSCYCDDSMAMAVILSMLPAELHKDPNILQRSYLHRLMEWFRASFSIIKASDITEEEGRDGSDSKELREVVMRRAGSPHQLCQIFISLLRALRIPTRYVCTFHPTPPNLRSFTKLFQKEFLYSWDKDTFDFQKFQKLYETSSSRSNSRTLYPSCWAEVLMQDDDHNSIMGITAGLTPQYQQISNQQIVDLTSSDARAQSDGSTAESLLLSDSSRWIHVDAVRMLMDEPAKAEACLLSECKAKALSYVVAVDENGFLTNVSDRYCMKPLESVTLRLKGKESQYWANLLEECNDMANIAVESGRVSPTRQLTIARHHARESLELQQHHALAHTAMPSTLAAFKSHPYYVLERFLTSRQSLHPSKKRVVGTFRGEGVYLREHVADLHSDTQWKKRARVVRPGELPVRVLQNRSKRRKSTDGGGGKRGESVRKPVTDEREDEPSTEATVDDEDSSTTINLYGEWQTDMFHPPIVVDGVIPVNSFGNVEVWGGNEAFLPIGSVLIASKKAMHAARMLGVPAAPALVDFETNAGKRVPKLGGAVVLEEHAEVVQLAALSMEEEALAKADAKRESLIIRRWELIVRSLVSRNALRKEYGY